MRNIQVITYYILYIYKKKELIFNHYLYYSVGALLWEIAELKKPHSDLNKSDILVGIRKRVSERHCLLFSDGIPDKWKILVASGKLKITSYFFKLLILLLLRINLLTLNI